MKKIVLPTDFSEASTNASKLAADIAQKTSSEIHLLHMIELPTSFIDMGGVNNFSIPESMLYIRKVRDRLVEFKKNFSKKLNIKHAIRFQSPFNGIRDYSKKYEADLIVMGSKGHTDLEEILIGSNTEKVVRNIETPVLVARSKQDEFKPKNLIFASSFKPEKNKAFERFLAFAKNFNSTIHLLKINTPRKFENTNASVEKIRQYVSKYNLPKHTINVYNDNSVEQGVLTFAEDINADLIALATHGRSGLSHILNGSITKHLSKKAQRPMLTFKV